MENLPLPEAVRVAPVPMALCAHGREGVSFVCVNDAMVRLTGHSAAELLTDGWALLGNETDSPGADAVRDVVLRHRNGGALPCRLHAAPVPGSDLLVVQLVETPHAPAPDATLLRDFRHRVMNHLQFIQSVIHMQSLRIESEPTQDALRDLGARIDALAVVYRQLYATGTDGRIELAEYLGQLVANLSSFYDREGRITVSVDAPDSSLLLPVERAFPLGLIVTELVVNSFKHAFRGRSGGTIRIALSGPGAGPIVVLVEDDGPGVADAAPTVGKRLGLTLIRSLANQIGGTVAPEPGRGARFVITVPLA
ncbi:sensor histidine kinase [Azospirillum halopraeferens]|uniref:sensor histidine kinase n=1 Tax=Azospirillum halopraeferens TaxID=34010 RepID=UPI00041F31B9|nr:sensor histidine kinase [Azospirillum halopraeferens]